MKDKYIWHKQSVATDLEIITCKAYDPIKDFVRDLSGFYLLIRVDQVKFFIEVAICDKNHVIVKVFQGKKAQDIYHAILQYEKLNGIEWFKSKIHLAYLGKELAKAQVALAKNEEYVQE